MDFKNQMKMCLFLAIALLVSEGQMADSALKRGTKTSHDGKARKHQQVDHTTSFLRAFKIPTRSLSKKYAVSYYNPSPYQSSYPSSYTTGHGYPYPYSYPAPHAYSYSPDAGYPGGYPALYPAGYPLTQPAPVGQKSHYHCTNSGSPRKNQTEKFEIKGKFFRSIGCWSDSSVRAISPLEGKHPLLKDPDYRSRANALMKCAEVAIEKNLSMFALQNGGQCFGGKDAEKSFRKYGPSTGCCGDGEGGQWSNEVYSFLGNNGESLVNASYNPWSSWSPCPQTCSNGNNTAVQLRNRTCFTSQVTYVTPGLGCGTTTIETRPCGVQICPVAPMTQPTTEPTTQSTNQTSPRPTPPIQQPPAAALIAPTSPSTPSSVCTAKVDLGILIDGSGSIEQAGVGNFKRELNFVKQIVSAFEVSRYGTHVGIIIFSSDAKVVSGFDAHYDKSSTLTAIDNIQYPRMGTNIGRALELARNNLYGKSARPGIPNMLIVLTDGQSQDPVTEAAQKLRDSGVTIFVVGIGNGYDLGQLRDMATDPDSQHVYKATFNNLDEVVKSIKDRACLGAGGTTKAPPGKSVPTISMCKAKVDLAILIDGSGSIEYFGKGNFKRCLKFVKRLIRGFNIAREGTHVGIVVFSQNADVIFEFETYFSLQQMLTAINRIKYPGRSTYTGKALNVVRTRLFDASARQGVPNILLVMTDGSSQDDIDEPSKKLRDMGVTVFSLGVGTTFDINQLNSMATDPDKDHVFMADFKQLGSSVIEKIKEKACRGSGGVLQPIAANRLPSGIRIKQCLQPLGMESKDIPDSQITASSEWNGMHGPSNARLNFLPSGGRIGAWSAKNNDVNQWLQVDLGQRTRVTGISTQGRSDYDQWVTSFTVSYSDNGVTFTPYNQNTVFKGNGDRNTIVSNSFTPSIVARYVRVHPKTWFGHISMRMELLGCTSGRRIAQCLQPLGMESKDILDSQITASTEWNSVHGPSNARLNFLPSGGRTGAWSAKSNDVNQWLQVDLGQKTRVTGITTQGRSDADQWVTNFTVSYSDDGLTFTPYNQNTVLTGNRDRNTIVFNRFRPSIFARYVRVYPKTWYRHISMRMELLGCKSGAGRLLRQTMPRYYTVGCYKDTSDRAIPTMEAQDPILDGRYFSRKDPIVKCAKAAWRAGYKMFAVQDGGWCASSATAAQTYNKHGRSTACKADGEGGPWANQVYSFRRRGRFRADPVGEDNLFDNDKHSGANNEKNGMKEQLGSVPNEQTAYEASDEGVLDKSQNGEEQVLDTTRQGENGKQTDSIGPEIGIDEMPEVEHDVNGDSDAEMGQETTKNINNTNMIDEMDYQDTNLANNQNEPEMSMEGATEPLKNDSEYKGRGVGKKAFADSENGNPVLETEGTALSDEQRTSSLEQMKEPGTLTEADMSNNDVSRSFGGISLGPLVTQLSENTEP